jgi:hypothetical protein
MITGPQEAKEGEPRAVIGWADDLFWINLAQGLILLPPPR